MVLTRDTFVLFGDPSLRVRAFVPQAVKVSHEVDRSANDLMEFKVTRKDPKKGQVPAKHAVVALSLDGKLVTSAVTDEKGVAKVEILASMEKKKLDLVVSGSRLVTYESKIRTPEREQEASENTEEKEKSESKEKSSSSESKSEDKESSKSTKDSQSSGDSSKGGKQDKDDDKKPGACAVGSDSSGHFGAILALSLLALRRRSKQR